MGGNDDDEKPDWACTIHGVTVHAKFFKLRPMNPVQAKASHRGGRNQRKETTGGKVEGLLPVASIE